MRKFEMKFIQQRTVCWQWRNAAKRHEQTLKQKKYKQSISFEKTHDAQNRATTM